MEPVFAAHGWSALPPAALATVRSAALALTVPPPWPTPRTDVDCANSIASAYVGELVDVLTGDGVVSFEHPGSLMLALTLYRATSCPVRRWAACWLATRVDIDAVGAALQVSETVQTRYKMAFGVHSCVHLRNLAMRVHDGDERAALLDDTRSDPFVSGVIEMLMAEGVIVERIDRTLASTEYDGDLFERVALDASVDSSGLSDPLVMALSLSVDPRVDDWERRERLRGGLLEAALEKTDFGPPTVMRILQNVIAGPGKGEIDSLSDLQQTGWPSVVLAGLGEHARRCLQDRARLDHWLAAMGEQAAGTLGVLRTVATFGID